MDTNFVMLGGIVLLSHATQALAGFGSIVIAVTLGAHLYPIAFLLPVVVPLEVLLNTYIVSRHRSTIHRPVLLKKILPRMGAGLLVGIILFQFIHGDLLKKIYGVVIVMISLFQLMKLLTDKTAESAPSPAMSRLLIFASGIVQGLYASGGPLLVYAVTGFGLSKSAFRSTLCALWLILNVVLIVSFWITGKMTAVSLKYTAMLIPVILIGIVIGESLHKTVNEGQFKCFIFVLLVVAGTSLILA